MPSGCFLKGVRSSFSKPARSQDDGNFADGAEAAASVSIDETLRCEKFGLWTKLLEDEMGKMSKSVESAESFNVVLFTEGPDKPPDPRYPLISVGAALQMLTVAGRQADGGLAGGSVSSSVIVPKQICDVVVGGIVVYGCLSCLPVLLLPLS
jgi:hypothetical protein